MAEHDPKHRQRVALFRYERIADLLRLEPGSKEWSRRLRERAAEELLNAALNRLEISALFRSASKVLGAWRTGG